MNNTEEAFVGIALLLLSGTIISFAMSRRRRSAFWKLCGLGAIAGLLFLFAIATIAQRSTHEARIATVDTSTVVLQRGRSSNRASRGHEHAPVLQRSTAQDPLVSKHPFVFGGGTAWRAEVDQEFEADVYPSATYASRALGRKIKLVIGRTIDRVNDTSETPIEDSFSIIQISGSVGMHPAASLILGDLAEVMRKEYETAEVLVESAPVQNAIQDLKAISIVVDIPIPLGQSRAVWDSKSSRIELSGSLRATVHWRFGSFSTTARFVEKPWVTNFSEYLAMRPGLQRLQAQSTRFANTEFDARQQALREAAVALLPILRQQLREVRARQRRGHLIYFQESDEQLINRLVAEMHKGNHVVDRFPQRLTRSYGDIWRETVLVDFSTPRLKYHTSRSHAASIAHRNSLGALMAQLVALLVFVCVFYFVLDAATKGYYVWVIRGIMIGGVVVGGLVLVLLNY